MVATGDPQELALLREFTDWSLQQAQTIVAADVSRWTLGVASLGHIANRLYTSFRDYRPIKLAKNKGMTLGMRFRFALVVWLFFWILLVGGVSNMIADIKELEPYYLRIRWLPAALSVFCLTLIFVNYAQIVIRGFKQHKIEKLLDRLRFANTVTQSRGVRLAELMLIPAAFALPWLQTIQLLRVLVNS